MKNIMHEIKKILNPQIKHFEIEHIESEPYFIDVRLYNEHLETAEKITEKIKQNDKIINAEAYTPLQEVINYGYSGHEFTGISIEVSLKDMMELNEDYLLMDDNEHII